MANLVSIEIRAEDLTGPGFAGVMARVAALKSAIGNIRVGFDTGLIDRQIATLKAKMSAAGLGDFLDANLPIGKLQSQIVLIKRLLQQAQLTDFMAVNLNESQVLAQAGKLRAILSQVLGNEQNIGVSLGTGGAIAQLAALRAAMSSVFAGGFGQGPSVSLNTAGAIAQLAALRAAMSSVFAGGFGQGPSMTLNTAPVIAQIGAVSTAFSVLRARALGAFASIGAGFTALSAVINGGGGAGGGGGGGGRGWFWGLFGGATIAGIAAWHVALDAAIEALIAVGTAAAAAAIGVLALKPAFQDIYTQLQSVRTVNSALGNQIPTLTSKFQQLQDSMAPQAIEIYGGALKMVSGNTGILGNIAHQVVDVFTGWIAKIDLWAQTSGTFNKLLQDGVGFLKQFGQVIGNVGDALLNLLRAEPGIAHFWMDILVGASKVLDIITKIPGPILTAVIALHGFYLMGRLLGSALLSIAGGVANMVRSLAGLAANPFFWVAAAAAGIGYLAYESLQASPAVKSLIDSMNTELSTKNASTAMIQMAHDIGVLNAQITKDLQPPHLTGWTAFWNGFTRVITLKGFPADSNPAENSITAMANAINRFVGQGKNMYLEIGHLMGQGRSYSESLALMDLAGVRVTDSFAVMRQKVDNLIAGYAQLSISGGILTNSVNALNFASLMQQTNVSQMDQAWSTFFSTVSGGASGFAAFELDVKTMNNSATTLSHTVGDLHLSFAGAAQAINGLSGKDLALRQSFVQTAQAAMTELNNLQDMATAAGLGAQGTAMVTQASKDLIAQQLPLARHSQELTTILYILAQRGGYQGADSFRALAKWIGNVHDPAKNLDKIVTTLTVDSGNLLTDVKNLSTALGTGLTAAMKGAIFFAAGGQQMFNNFATALQNTGVNSFKTNQAAGVLATGLFKLTGNSDSAHREFDTFVVSMVNTQTGLHYTKYEADKLWGSLSNLNSIIHAGNQPRGTLINDLHNAGVNAQTSARLVGNLQTAIGNLHGKTVSVQVQAAASGVVRAIAAGNILHHASQESLAFSAAGGIVTGGTPGQDSVLVMAMPGEAIVPVSKVAQVAPALSAAGVPGFASGGVVGELGGFVPWASNVAGQWGAATAQDFGQAAVSGFQATVKAILAAVQSAFGGGPGGGAPAANAALARRMMPLWGSGPEWSAWNAVAMAESGWNQFASNPGSGAYGIPQALPFTKMPKAAWPASAGGSSNPAAQIGWMIGYIKSVYGDPIVAELHEQMFHWYDGGGFLRGPSLVMNGTGRPERVLSPDEKFTLEVVGGDSEFEQFMAKFFKKYVRVHGGGSVQLALGHAGR